MDIVSRAKNMIMSPAAEWPVVAGEPATVGGLYQGYIIPLAAIPPIATLIGHLLFGHVGFGAALILAIVTFVLSLVVVYVIGWVAAMLAPSFEGRNDNIAGLKLAAYGSTAAWVGGIFHIIPALGILAGLAALYGIYLFYTGITPVMGVPSNRAVIYLIVLIVAWIVLSIIVGIILALVIGGSMVGAGMMM